MGNFVTRGTKTSTGGEVLEGHDDVKIAGQSATSIGQKASCASGRKECKGVGVIVPVGSNQVYLPNGKQAALPCYQVMCNCPDNIILEPSNNVSIGSNMHFTQNVSEQPLNKVTQIVDTRALSEQKTAIQKNRIHIGKEREISGAILSPRPESTKLIELKGKQVKLSEVLEKNFTDQPVDLGLLNSQILHLSSETLKNIKEGGDLVFCGMQYQHTYGALGSIRIVDTFSGEMPDQKTSQMAYWVAQGKYLDIPKHPNPHRDHLYVLTPSFSGCSLVVDNWSEDLIRVYHVEGGKENKQYNNLKSHGKGLINYMSFRDYGFYQEGDTTIENITGFAFMHYSLQTKKWNIHYQKQEHAPSIKLDPVTSRTLAMVSKNSRVVGVGSIIIE